MRGDALAFAFLCLVMLATRAIWFGDPIADHDEQLYSFIGWRMTLGEMPFVDWWDRKPFGLFAIFAFAHALMGPEPIAFQLIGAVFAMAGAVLVYLLARLQLDRACSAIAGGLYLTLIAAYGSHSGQSEVFFAPLMLGMVWLLRDPAHANFTRRAMWAMLLGGLALQIKYTVVPQCIALGLYALWQQHKAGMNIGRIAASALGFAALGLLPTALVGLLYAAMDEFSAFAFANFLSFFDRVAAGQGRWLSSHWTVVAPLGVLALGGIAAKLFALPSDNPRFALYLLWALASLATVLLPSTVYLYYYASIAAPAVLLALPLMKRTGLVGSAILLLALLWMLDLPGRYDRSMEERAAVQQLANAIAPHVDRTDNCLFVFDGPTALYRMSGSCVPTRYVYPDHLNNALENSALGVAQDAEVARILVSLPGAIVTADRPLTTQNQVATGLVETAIYIGYEEAESALVYNRTFTVWVRKGS